MEPAQSKALPREELRGVKKWTSLPQKALIGSAKHSRSVVLGDFFNVKRGIATGDNSFFIVPKSNIHHLGIPLACVHPILPSPRYLKQVIIEADDDGWPVIDNQLALVDCHLREKEISRKWPRFLEYLELGKRNGVPNGYLASRRSPWYSQEKRDVPMLLCTYMGRSLTRPFRFLWNKSQATAANVYLLLYPKPFVAERVRNKAKEVFGVLQAIHPEQFFSEGRVYGGGLHKMEPAELMRLPANDLEEILGPATEHQGTLF
jgi:hypothetical protein